VLVLVLDTKAEDDNEDEYDKTHPKIEDRR
jgi:hypothetical protein